MVGFASVLFFFLFASFALAQVTGNLGIAMRQKAQLMPFFFIIFCKATTYKGSYYEEVCEDMILDTGYWILDTGYWILILDTGITGKCKILNEILNRHQYLQSSIRYRS
jgi:hypothetical protein